MGMTMNDELLRDFFGTQEHRTIFDAQTRLQSWLDVERALAETQAAIGIIPQEASEKIVEACESRLYNMDKLRIAINLSQHPLVPVVNALEKMVGIEFARFVHFGATTQDIMDTGQSLQLRSSLILIEKDIISASHAARALSLKFRNTVQAGRTHGQHAVPITFGLKVASWLDELNRFLDRLKQARPRMLTAQVFGAAGTMAAYGEKALEVKAGVSEALGLTNPGTPWHANRDRIAELAALMSLLAGAAERIASEVIRLQSTEFGEVAEPLIPGHIGSSTMPQKRNPHLSEGIVAKSRLIQGLASTLMRNTAHQHERDMGAWAVEWIALPEMMVLAGAAAADLVFLLEGLIVHESRMHTNLNLTKGQISSESLMMGLAPSIGRDHAHELLIELTRKADAEEKTLAEVVLSDNRIRSHLTVTEMNDLLDPMQSIGIAPQLVDLANEIVS